MRISFYSQQPLIWVQQKKTQEGPFFYPETLRLVKHGDEPSEPLIPLKDTGCIRIKD